MVWKGRVHLFGDNISTDHIIPGRYFHLRTNLEELAKHVLEDADPDFLKKFRRGDFVVGGENFGCGSSREHAPRVLKVAGVRAVLARSFARIFFRNSINIGLPVIEIDTEGFQEGDEIEVYPEKGEVRNLTRGITRHFPPLPEFLKGILETGGLKEYVKRKGDL